MKDKLLDIGVNLIIYSEMFFLVIIVTLPALLDYDAIFETNYLKIFLLMDLIIFLIGVVCGLIERGKNNEN